MFTKKIKIKKYPKFFFYFFSRERVCAFFEGKCGFPSIDGTSYCSLDEHPIKDK